MIEARPVQLVVCPITNPDYQWMNNCVLSQEVAEGTLRLLGKCGYLGPDGVENVRKALQYAHEMHSKYSIPTERAFRQDGLEYTTHLLATCEILADLRCNSEVLQAGLLHDTVENTTASIEDLTKEFGVNVSSIVDTVTKVEDSMVETILKVLAGLKENPAAILVKLADRLHNMRTISFLKPKKQRKIAYQTLQVFAPLARELGLEEMADELTDLSFETLWPQPFKKARKIQSDYYNPQLLSELISPIEQSLEANRVVFQVKPASAHKFIQFTNGRAKAVDYGEAHIDIECVNDQDFEKTLSYFQKYYPQRDLAGQVHDGRLVLAFPIGELRFSLVIYSPQEQYRKHASLASLYQIESPQDPNTEKRRDYANSLLNKLTSLLDQIESPLKSGEQALKVFTDFIKYPLISVMTPANEVRVLPFGATALDYAFSLTNDIGLQAIKAIVNDTEVPLSTGLTEGDNVEIETSTNKHWAVTVDMLDYIFNERYKLTIRRALGKILKTDENRKKSPVQRSKAYQKDFKIMGYSSENELENAAAKVRQDAENRGEKKILQAYRDLPVAARIHDQPIVDIDRGMKTADPRFRRLYGGNFSDFLSNCGLETVPQEVINEYARAILEYETAKLRHIKLIVPNKPWVLARLLNIAGIFANLADLNLTPNVSDLQSGFLEMGLALELENNEVYKQLEKVLGMMVNLMMSEANQQMPAEIRVNWPPDENLLPLLGVIDSLDLTPGSITREDAQVILGELKRLNTQTSTSQSLTLLGELEKMISQLTG